MDPLFSDLAFAINESSPKNTPTLINIFRLSTNLDPDREKMKVLKVSDALAVDALEEDALFSEVKEATRWLGVWLDSQLKLTSHINERVRRARAAEIQIKGLTRTHGLVPGLVRRIQLAVVQSTAVYSAELWWKGQKTMKIPSSSYLIGKRNQLQECILVLRYIHSWVKRA